MQISEKRPAAAVFFGTRLLILNANFESFKFNYLVTMSASWFDLFGMMSTTKYAEKNLELKKVTCILLVIMSEID